MLDSNSEFEFTFVYTARQLPLGGNHKMEILYVLIPVSVLLVLAILVVLGWSVHSGQFEDIEQEGLRILQPEVEAEGSAVEPRQK